MARSVMKHQFSRIPHANIPRSSFDRSHGLKTTFDSGFLVPIFIDEALPGDTFNLRMTAFARLATPIKPFMDNLFFETFFFAVPNRLVWDNWQRFNGEQTNPGDSTDFVIPKRQITAGNNNTGTLQDYFGLPVVGHSGNITVSDLPFRSYNLIWNEWFRDQNLQSSAAVEKGDAPGTLNDYVIRRRNKRHDYFTSCLPWPQKGASVDIPLGQYASVLSNTARGEAGDTGIPTFSNAGGGLTSPIQWETGAGNNASFGSNNPSTTNAVWAGGEFGSGLVADLSGASAATINQLRQAFQVQKMFERDARSGTRYTEIVRSHFGVVSPDSRLQRPEYLGGGRSYVNINAVEQTTPSNVVQGATPQGNLAAYGTVSARNHGFVKSFTEHCIIIGLANVRADLTYQQGTNRMWSRSTRFDFYWPALSHIGEQAVDVKEIYDRGTAAGDAVFGYQERYAEYRYKPSLITGVFRSDADNSLDVWHLSQKFTAQPALNEAFIEDKPPIDRVIAVQNEPQFLLDAYFNLRCARPMPVYGVPGLIDHF